MFGEPLPESFANLELVVNVININKGRNEEFAIHKPATIAHFGFAQ